MLIPETSIENDKWNLELSVSGGYFNSYMNKTVLSIASNNLKTVLGNHLINRNVLLSSNTSSGKSSAYTWTTAYATLPSVGQLTGNFAQHNNKYDDGEANYKLPLFDHMEYGQDEIYWTRCIKSPMEVYYITLNGIGSTNPHLAEYVRPLIYIR